MTRISSSAKLCRNSINASCALFRRRGKFPRRRSVCERRANQFGRVPGVRAIIHSLALVAPRAASFARKRAMHYIRRTAHTISAETT